MSYRITAHSLTSNSLLNLQRTSKRYDTAVEQLSSMKRINRPSDDPVNAARAINLRNHVDTLDSYESLIDQSKGMVEQGSSMLQDVSSMLVRAREIAVEGADSGIDQDQRDHLAQEVDDMIEDVLSVANTNYVGRYIFGGTRTDAKPFEEIYDKSGKLSSVAYNGSDKPIEIEIAPSVTTPLNEPGDAIFQARERQATTFEGVTGAAPGVGGDTGVGVERLTLTHTATDYSAAVTGIAAGTNSAQDNIIGAHTITVDTVAGTIQLDSGQPVAISGTANDRLTDGVHTVYVDTTGPLVSGVDTITGNGVLNAGDADVAINFTNNQQVVTSDGRTMFVDTTAAHQTGTEVVTFNGTVDVFETLIYLRDSLYNVYNESEPDQLSRISGCLDYVTQAQDDVLAGAATMGNRVKRLEATHSRVESLGLTATDALSKTEDADAAKVIVDMKSEQAALQAALAATSSTLRLSLLDYLY